MGVGEVHSSLGDDAAQPDGDVVGVTVAVGVEPGAQLGPVDGVGDGDGSVDGPEGGAVLVLAPGLLADAG
ncbi:MAG: hypothetical protein GEV03_15360 [Streptosporangiales bacterium]|nr:hypothetical protein [Streptosporangiales bacterium]